MIIGAFSRSIGSIWLKREQHSILFGNVEAPGNSVLILDAFST